MPESALGLIVTAGSDPINMRVAEVLRDDGFQVVHVREAELDEAPKGITSIVHPVSDFASAQSLMETIASSFGLVTGIVTPLLPTTSRSMTDIDSAGWAEFRTGTIKRNVALAKAGVLAMPDSGRVIVLASTSAFYGAGLEQAAAQAAMISLSNAITLTAAATNVTSNCVVVGDGSDRGGLDPTAATSGDMVGQVVSYLFSDQADDVSGQLVACSGTTVGLYVPPLIIESTNVLVTFGSTPTSAQIGAALAPLLETGKA